MIVPGVSAESTPFYGLEVVEKRVLVLGNTLPSHLRPST